MPDTYQETIRLRVEVDSSDVGKAVQSEQQRANQRLRQQSSIPQSPNLGRSGGLNWDQMRGVFGATNTLSGFLGGGRNIFGIPQYQMMSMSRMFGGMGHPSASHYQSIRASEINRMAREAAQARTTRPGVTPQAIASETKAYFETLKGLRQTAEQIIKGSLASGKLILPMTMGGPKFDAASQAYKDLAQSMGYSVGDFQKSGPFSQASIGALGGKSQKFGKSDEDKALIEEEKKRLVSEEIKKKVEADKKIAEQAMKAAATGAKFVGGIEIAASVAIQMGQVLKSISSSLSNFAASFATGDVSKAMHGVVDALQGIAHGIGAGTSAIVGSIGLVIGSAFGPIGTMIGAAAGALVGNILGGALSAVAGLFNTFITAMDSLVNNLSKWNPSLAAMNAQLNIQTILFQRQMSYAMQPALLAWIHLKEVILDKLISYAPQINALANWIANLITGIINLAGEISAWINVIVTVAKVIYKFLIAPILEFGNIINILLKPVRWLIDLFGGLGHYMELLFNPIITLIGDFVDLGGGITKITVDLLDAFGLFINALANAADEMGQNDIAVSLGKSANELIDAASKLSQAANPQSLSPDELAKQAEEWGKAFMNSLGDFAKANGSGGIDKSRPLGAALHGLIGGNVSGGNSNVQTPLSNIGGAVGGFNIAANTMIQAANVMVGAANVNAIAAGVNAVAKKFNPNNPAGATAKQIAAANFIAQGHGKYNVDFGSLSQNQYSAGISGGVDIGNIPSHRWFKDKIYKTPWSTAFGSRNRLKYPGYLPYDQWADIVGASQGTGLGKYPDTGSTIGAMGSKYGSSGSYSDSGNIVGAMGNKYGGSDLSSGFMTFQQWRVRKLQRAGQKNLKGQNIDDPDYSGVDPNLVWAYKLRNKFGIDGNPGNLQVPPSDLLAALHYWHTQMVQDAGSSRWDNDSLQWNAAFKAYYGHDELAGFGATPGSPADIAAQKKYGNSTSPTTQPSTPSDAFIQSIGGKVTPAPSGQLDRYGRSPDDPNYLSAFKTDPQKDTDSWKKARNITTDSERALAEYKKDIHKTGPQMPHAAVALNAQFNNTFNQTIEEQEVNRAIWQVREFLLNTFNCHRNETQLWLATLEGSMIADSV